MPWFVQIVAAARAYGLDVIDGPCNDFRDSIRLEAECVQARSLGMDGKSIIHPDQIETANRVFAPTGQERAEAEKIVTAFAAPENQGKAVLALDGHMIERLHLPERSACSSCAAIAEREAG